MANSRLCAVDNCGKSAYSRGWCMHHYYKLRPSAPCAVDGCKSASRSSGLCEMHYRRRIRHGDPLVKKRPANGEGWDYMMAHMWDDCPKWPFTRDQNGYARINTKEGIPKNVHRIVCEVVHGPPPSSSHQAAHSCGKGNEGCFGARCVSWKTQKENEEDKLVHGTRIRGSKNYNAKLTELDVFQIRSLRGIRQKDIAEIYGISKGHVKSIMSRKRWGWLK